MREVGPDQHMEGSSERRTWHMSKGHGEQQRRDKCKAYVSSSSLMARNVSSPSLRPGWSDITRLIHRVAVVLNPNGTRVFHPPRIWAGQTGLIGMSGTRPTPHKCGTVCLIFVLAASPPLLPARRLRANDVG